MSERHIALIGNVNVDIIMGPQEPWPRPGTEVVLRDYELRVGGQAGNAALALAARGAPFRLIASAGNDVFGGWLSDAFGAAAADWRRSDAPTTVSVGITHPNGERTFFTNHGHLDRFGPDDILPFIPERAQDGSIALLVGIFLSPDFQAGLAEIMRALRRAGYRIALDPGWPPEGWSEVVRRHFGSWLEAADLVLVNETEACAATEARDLATAVERLRRRLRPDGTLLVKRGAEGASAWRGEEFRHAPSPAIIVADSIGAGDVFNAGFLAAELAGAPLAEALRAGVALAAAVIASSPRRYDVEL